MIERNTNLPQYDYDAVPEGIQVSSAYIVQYEEDLWMKMPQETQQHCKDTWIKFAEPLGLEEVVLRLIPDPVFPGFGKEKPYIHWRHRFPKDLGGDWEVKCVVYLCTNDNSDSLTQAMRIKLISYYDKYPKGTRFITRNLQGRQLWEHTT